MTLSADTTAPPIERAHLRTMIILIVIEIFAVFETAMAIAAIPSFMRVFEADAASAGWTTTAYLLVGACFAATAGRLGDIFGRRKVLVAVLAGAACGSLISALADDLWMITLGRGVQGLAAGALPLSFGLVRELLPRRQVPIAIALLGGIIPICSGAGALIAGVLLDHSGWRMIFIVATGLGTAAAVTALAGVPRTGGITPRPTVDMAGAVLLIPSVGGVLFGVSKAGEWGWTDRTVLASILVGLVTMVLWVWWERRVREPVVDVRRFTDRKVALTTAATITVGAGPMGAAALLSPMILQLPESAPVGQGLSATMSGVVMLIASTIGYGGAALSGRIAQLVGARWALMAGCVLYIAGAGMWIFLAQSLPGTVICTSLIAIGSAFTYSAFANLIVEAVPSAQTGEATGMNRVTLNVAVAAGLSITSVILAASTAPGTHLPTETALTAVCLFMVGCSVLSLLFALLIGGLRRVPVDAAPAPGLSAEQATA